MRIVAACVAGLGIFACTNVRVHAQTDTSRRIPHTPYPAKDSGRISLLRAVTVRSAKLPLSHLSPIPVQVLSGEALLKMNSLSVADAVRYFSGLQLKDYGGIGGLKTVNVRSMGTNHTAVFYDGLQLGNAQNGQVDLGKFSLDNLEEITLYNGQRNVLLQPARSLGSAAAIYLRSKRPVFTDGQQTNASIRFRTGSFGLINPSLLLEQQLSKRIAATLSSEWTHAHGRYKFRYTNGVYDTTAVRQNADIDAWRMEAGLHGAMRDSSEWQVKLYSYWSERGLPGAIVANVFRNPQRQWDRNLFAQASWQKLVNRRYSLLLNGKYAYDRSRYLDPNFNNIEGYLDNTYKQQELYFSVANQYRITPHWDLALSGDWQWNRLDANIFHFPYPTRHTVLAALVSRLSFKRFEAQGNVLGTFVQEKVKQFNRANDQTEFTPGLMVSWQPFTDAGFRLRAFYKNIFRMPTFNDLYYTFIGNTLLRPEFTNQYNAGFSFVRSYQGALRSFSLQADAYYNEVKDKIVAVPTENLLRWTMLNLDKVSIKGIDAGMQTLWQLLRDAILTTRLSYTYQRAEDITPGSDTYRHQIPYMPWHSGSVTAGIEWRQWSLNYSFIYTGERYDQIANIPENYLEPWYTSDCSLSWQCALPKRTTARVMLEVNNLLNQYYDVVINYPMPGRYARITFTLQR